MLCIMLTVSCVISPPFKACYLLYVIFPLVARYLQDLWGIVGVGHNIGCTYTESGIFFDFIGMAP